MSLIARRTTVLKFSGTCLGFEVSITTPGSRSQSTYCCILIFSRRNTFKNLIHFDSLTSKLALYQRTVVLEVRFPHGIDHTFLWACMGISSSANKVVEIYIYFRKEVAVFGIHKENQIEHSFFEEIHGIFSFNLFSNKVIQLFDRS